MHTSHPRRNMIPWVIGGLLLITPFILGGAAFSSPLLGAWILGALVSIVAVSLALLWMSFPHQRLLSGLTALVGLVLVLAPWALGASLLTVSSLASCLVGGSLLLAANWSARTVQSEWDQLLTDRTMRGRSSGSEGFSSSRRMSHPASMR